MIGVALSGAFCGLGGLFVLRQAGIFDNDGVCTWVVHRLFRSRRSDCAILRVSADGFAASLLMWLLGGAFGSSIAAFALSVIGVDLPVLVNLCVVLCGPIAATAMFLERLSKDATKARRTFSYALSSYLDLASVLLAGGAGSETALIAAAATGDSWSFRMIRETLETARAGRTPSWRAFGELGRRIGVVDLERLAGSMQLAGEHGAKVRVSLATQAGALRARQIGEIEADAQAATERMGVPTVLLFVGFIALLGYPALELVVGQM
jgi:Flp pilus assembly protein TadB